MTATLPLPTLPLDLLTTEQTEEKLDIATLNWHYDILAERQKALAEGRTHFIPLDEFIALARR